MKDGFITWTTTIALHLARPAGLTGVGNLQPLSVQRQRHLSLNLGLKPVIFILTGGHDALLELSLGRAVIGKASGARQTQTTDKERLNHTIRRRDARMSDIVRRRRRCLVGRAGRERNSPPRHSTSLVRADFGV